MEDYVTKRETQDIILGFDSLAKFGLENVFRECK